jgi:hypothetical protein
MKWCYYHYYWLLLLLLLLLLPLLYYYYYYYHHHHNFVTADANIAGLQLLSSVLVEHCVVC